MAKKWVGLIVVLGALVVCGLVGLSQTNASVAKSNPDGSVAYSPNDSQSDNVIELKATTESGREWQCMVWWTTECLDYDTHNCDSCYIPCVWWMHSCVCCCRGVLVGSHMLRRL